MDKFTVQLMTEFGTPPVWVLDEDHIPCQEGFLPIIEKDPEIRELSKRIEDMFDSYYSFNSHDCACYFDYQRRLEEADDMLDLAWCLYARVNELNDGSFYVQDDLIPRLEELIEEGKRLPNVPDEIVSAQEIDPYFPLQARFNVRGGDRRYARFLAPDDSFVEFWIQDATDLPEEMRLCAWGPKYKRIGDSLPAVSPSGERVNLGFSNNVRCKGIDVSLYDDGALIVFSSESPTDWRKAGDILFGYDEDVNLLAIMFTSTSKSDMELIEEYLKEQR